MRFLGKRIELIEMLRLMGWRRMELREREFQGLVTWGESREMGGDRPGRGI